MGIANIAIKVTADAKGVTQGLQKGAAEIDKFAGHARESLTRALAVGGIALGGLGSIEAFGARREELIETSKAADKLGLSMRDMQKINLAAAGADVSHAIGIMARTLTDAEIGANGAADTLALFGMKAEEFKGLGIDQALAKLSDRFKNITDPMEKAKFAMTFFGRGGMEMFELLEKGSKGLEEAGARVDKFKTALNDVQSANLRDSQRALKDLGLEMKGVGNQIAGNTAPAVESMAKDLTRLGEGDFMSRVQRGFARWSAGFADLVHGITGGSFDKQLSASDKLYISRNPDSAFAKQVMAARKPEPKGGAGIEPLDKAAEKEAASLDKLISSLDIKNQHLDAGANEMKVYAAAAEAANMAQEEFDALLAKAKGTDLAVGLHNFTEQLEKEAATLEMSANQAKVWEMAHRGLKGAALDSARALAQENDAMRLEKETQTPLEKFHGELDKLDAMGLDKNSDLYAKGVRKAAGELQSSLGTGQTVFSPAAALAGSAEAMSLISQFQNRTQGDMTPDLLKELIRQAAEQNRHQQELIQQFRQALQKNPDLVEV